MGEGSGTLSRMTHFFLNSANSQKELEGYGGGGPEDVNLKAFPKPSMAFLRRVPNLSDRLIRAKQPPVIGRE